MLYVLAQQPCVAYGRDSEETQATGQSEHRGEGEGMGQVVQALRATRGLGFYPKEGGSPGALWAEKWDLTQVLTGALWLLWEEQAVGDDGRSCGAGKEGTGLIPVSDRGGRPGRE